MLPSSWFVTGAYLALTDLVSRYLRKDYNQNQYHCPAPTSSFFQQIQVQQSAYLRAHKGGNEFPFK